jgi:hypothetical protein
VSSPGHGVGSLNLLRMTTYVAVFALLLAYAALVAAYFALRTLARVRRSASLATRASQTDPDLWRESTQRHAQSNAAIADQVRELRAHVDDAKTDMLNHIQAALRTASGAGALRNVALVRYDAFTDMSGRLSFSLALLDSRGDGVAISALTGHADTQVYAKGITAGKGEHELSPEEKQAVSAALDKPRSGLLNRKAG